MQSIQSPHFPAAPEPHDLGFSLYMADSLLSEAAQMMGADKVSFPDLPQTLSARQTLSSCQKSVGVLDIAFPTPREIVADIYWDVSVSERLMPSCVSPVEGLVRAI